MQSAACYDRFRPSVSLSVTVWGYCVNDSSYDHAIFTGESSHESGLLVVKFSAKFKWNIGSGGA